MDVVDVEDETLLSAIFRDAFSDNLRDNPEFGHYLAELSSYGVDRLSREPDRLAEERAQILEQTQDLAFHNYRTFIQTADCCREIFQDFQIIEKHLDSMLSKLPELTKMCDVFIKQAHNINVSRRTNNVTLQKHAQLLEILEMPQLMDTCVRNGYYDEALELATYVLRLEKKHASTIPVIANIVGEVKMSSQLMLNQLVHQLRSNIQLPACLRVIGYLRRMDVFTEAELRIKFLQARDAWFQSVLNSIPTDDPYLHISKTIEASRVHLFDIITQYRAIFTDDDLLSTTTDSRPSDSMLFHGWVIRKVMQFLRVLERDLELGVGGRLDSVLGQCMYFGLSFSRVGADFRGLLAPIFQRAALSGFESSIHAANRRFEEQMQSYTLLTNTSLSSSSYYHLASQSATSLQPPSVLLEFNPLAVYCNAILNAFNDLRLCSPLSLACDVSKELEASLHEVCRLLVAYHRSDKDSFTVQEQDRFKVLCRAFACDLVPFLNKCLQALFPPSQLTLALGVQLMDHAKKEKIGMVDVDSIIDPLQPFIPPPVTAVTTDASANLAEIKVLNSVELDSQADSSQVELQIEVSNEIVLPSEEHDQIDAQHPVQDGVKDTLEAILAVEVEQLTLNSPSDGVGSPTKTTVEADSKDNIS